MKVVLVLAVSAFAFMSSMATAADINVSGQMDIRSRDFTNLDHNKNIEDTEKTSQVDTQERIRLEVNVKADGASGKIAIENDFDTWGRNDSYQAANTTTNAGVAQSGNDTFLRLREAWIKFPVPGLTDVGVKAGHQLLQLSNGWFFRAMKYGSDAWVLYADPNDQVHVGFVNIKVGELDTADNHDDLDAYTLVGNYKVNDTLKGGINLTQIKDRSAIMTDTTNGVMGRLVRSLGAPAANGFEEVSLTNIGLFLNAKLGPVKLDSQLDYQTGKAKAKGGSWNTNDVKLSGNQLVIQGTMPTDLVTINFTAARGTGATAEKLLVDHKMNQVVTAMDNDMHYTLLYEYKISNPFAINGASTKADDDNLHFGFANTSALEAGLMAYVSKNVAIGADLWYLQSTEKVQLNNGDTTHDLGVEIDAKANWTISPNLSWNWTAGYFKPGKAYITYVAGAATGKDASTGVQGILTLKF